MPKFKLDKPLTKRNFEKLLTQASQPLSESSTPDLKVKQTSVVHPSDGCSDKRKSRGKTEGKEG